MKTLPRSNFSAESKGTLKVKVISDELPVSNVTVVLKGENGEVYNSRTGTVGGCSIRDVPYGKYKLSLTNTPSIYKEYLESEIEFNEDTGLLTIELEKQE